MSLKTSAKTEGGEFEQVPEGQYVGRCFRILDLGTQQSSYMGKDKIQKKVLIAWELLGDAPKMSDGRPFSISRTYTNTLDDRGNLYADLTAWRGKSFTKEELEEFDLSKVLGAYAQVQVTHNKSEDGTKTFANLGAIMAYKGEKFKPVNENQAFDVDEPDIELLSKLPEYYQKKIKESLEWKEREAYGEDLVTAPVSDERPYNDDESTAF